MVFVVSLIRHAIVAERHVANGEVKEAVGQGGILIPLHGDVGVLIELLRYPARDGIKLNAIELAFAHRLRHKPEEIADTAGRLQHIAHGEAHICNALIYRLDYRGACVMGVQRGFAGRTVFALGQ